MNVMSRTEILEACPEGFRDKLDRYIDDIKHELKNINNDLTISSIGDLHKLENAKGIVEALFIRIY